MMTAPQKDTPVVGGDRPKVHNLIVDAGAGYADGTGDNHAFFANCQLCGTCYPDCVAVAGYRVSVDEIGKGNRRIDGISIGPVSRKLDAVAHEKGRIRHRDVDRMVAGDGGGGVRGKYDGHRVLPLGEIISDGSYKAFCLFRLL